MKKFCVIGVGRFGYHVAVTLADNGMDVVAVDSNQTIIAEIRDKVTQAICMQVHDEESLRSIGIEEMDTVIVAMGENFAQSILVTALLKQRIKIPTVITRSISEIHRDIVLMIGADQVVLPEREVGRRLADSLSLPFKALTRLTSQFCIAEIPANPRFGGLTIAEANFQANHNITCIGYRNENNIVPFEQDYRILTDDLLIFSGLIKDITKFSKS